MHHEEEMIDSKAAENPVSRPQSVNVKYSVIIRDISFHCTEKDLYSLFGVFSTSIFRLTVRRNEEDGRSLLHAFADCKDREGAARLIERFNNVKFMGRVMKLEFCDARQKNVTTTKLDGFQIHVDYISCYKNQVQERVTEKLLERDCSIFGEIADVVIKRHQENLDNENQEILFQKGFAFIYFKDLIAAQRAVNVSQFFIQAGKIACRLSFSHKTQSSFTENPHLRAKAALPSGYPQSFYPSQGYQYQPTGLQLPFPALSYPLPAPIQISSPGFTPPFSSDSFSPSYHGPHLSPFDNGAPFLLPHLQNNQLQQHHHHLPVSFLPPGIVPGHYSSVSSFTGNQEGSNFSENIQSVSYSPIPKASSTFCSEYLPEVKSKLRGKSKKHRDNMRNL